MTEKILNNNQVVVAGEIVSDFRFSHEIFGEGFYMVDLVVSRLSDAHDVIPLMVSDRLFDVEKSHIGEKVLAKGQFRSYNKHEENKNRLILSVFVREIEVIDAVDDKENKPNQIYFLHKLKSRRLFKLHEHLRIERLAGGRRAFDGAEIIS